AIRAEGWGFISGQVAVDPATGNLMQGDITAQTTQVMKSLRVLLEAAGSGFDQVVKTTVYLKSMNDFTAMNEVYGRHFAAGAPARATVEVSRLPKEALVEIDVVALVRK